MTTRRPRSRRALASMAPLLAVLLLGLRLLAPGAAPPPGPDLLALSPFPICHAMDNAPAPDAPAIPDGDCPLCPICHLAAGPLLLPDPQGMPVPHRSALGRADAPATPAGLPGQHRGPARARGPPVPV